MSNKPKKILIADDEADILEIIQYNLSKEGFEVHTAKDGVEAYEKAKQIQPDLIILDIMMPRKTGIEVCQQLRMLPAFQHTFILFLTALTDEETHLKGFETGADDYIRKPISAKILVSRVNAFFRHKHAPKNQILKIGNITIDPQQFVVIIDGVEKILAKKEFELLHLLASKAGQVFLRNEILSKVWGTEVIVGDRTIDVHVRKIRQKLGVDCITTVKGVGYKFEL